MLLLSEGECIASPSKIVPKLFSYLRLEPRLFELLEPTERLLLPKLLLPLLKLLRLELLDELRELLELRTLELLDELRELLELRTLVLLDELLLLVVFTFRLLDDLEVEPLLLVVEPLLLEVEPPLTAEPEPLDEELLEPVNALPRLEEVPRRVEPVSELFKSLLMGDSTLLSLPLSTRPASEPLPSLSPRTMVVPGRAELLPGRAELPLGRVILSTLELEILAGVSCTPPRSLPRPVEVPPKRSL